MSTYDLTIKIRSYLLSDTTLKNMLSSSSSVRVTELPKEGEDKQITIRKSWGKSDSIILSTVSTLHIFVWVRQKKVDEPYKNCVQIVERVLELLNRKGSSLNESTLIVNQITKTSADITFDEGQEYWVGTVILEVITNE